LKSTKTATKSVAFLKHLPCKRLRASYVLIYINDLVELLSRYDIKVKLFADDVKLYIKVVNEVDVVVPGGAYSTSFLGRGMAVVSCG